MNTQDVRSRMNEFKGIRKDAGDDKAALLEVALFVEDVFGITLTDGEICKENLGTHQDTETFVLKKLNVQA